MQNTLTDQQMFEAARHMQTANYGSFAACIASAYIVADAGNKDRIAKGFSDLFNRVYRDLLASKDINYA